MFDSSKRSKTKIRDISLTKTLILFAVAVY
jgi:hypothetical protein